MTFRNPLVFLTPLVVACKAPPQAPAKLEELATYIFQHMGDEEPDALEAGVANLDVWLSDNIESAREGYTVSKLSAKAMEDVGVDSKFAENLVGAAVATNLPKSPKAVTKTLVTADLTRVYPDTYSVYERDWVEGAGCFHTQECDVGTLKAHTVSQYPLSVEVTSDFKAEYRWIEMDRGLAMVQRTWLRKPAEVSADWLSVPAQFFISVNFPQNGATLRLQTTWIAAELGDSPIPEATALNMVIDSMVTGDEELTEWMQ